MNPAPLTVTGVPGTLPTGGEPRYVENETDGVTVKVADAESPNLPVTVTR